MLSFPNAKINLGLHIIEKRSDGYHNLQTIFYPVPYCDALEIVQAGDKKFEFVQTGIPIPGNATENLCVKTWELLSKHYNLPPVKIHLHKVIPTGAGLGGGSSDAAFLIKMIADLFIPGLSLEEQENYARQLGSDCAFFIKNKPVLAFGKGDQFRPLNIDLTGYFAVIVKPAIHSSTADAYASIKPRIPDFSAEELAKIALKDWHKYLTNDFEKPVFSKYPLIGEIKKQLYASGALFAMMSGSGSAVFGIFNKKTDLKKTFSTCTYWSDWL
ncbi:MAG TPA: 4-(cytidine 5'-diphospho)-2-C-methyl-D-erythritol kinase [Bacteroidales bacterium]|nr:4-(cytidine 5'-diphospho)-2-C-methyl-D-erythritol kinase [Bacteroidales bacterium]